MVKFEIPHESGNYQRDQTVELRVTMSELRLSKGEFLGYAVKADKVVNHIPVNQFLKKLPPAALVFRFNAADRHLYADYQNVVVNVNDSFSNLDPMSNSLLIETSSQNNPYAGLTEAQLQAQ